jgi:hypothetical protein
MLRKPVRSARKRPCRFCGEWFQPDPRVGDRQRACSKPACQQARQRRQQAEWRGRNPDYFASRRWRAATEETPPPQPPPTLPRSPPPLEQVPWDVVQSQFKAQQTVILALLVRVLVRARNRRDAPIPLSSQGNPDNTRQPSGKRRLTRAP